VDKIDFLFINKRIIPNRIIYQKSLYVILDLPEDHIINGYLIITNHQKIKKIILNGYHPNCDPDNHIYCLSDKYLNVEPTDSVLNIIENNLRTFYFDECYYTLWKSIKYKKVNSMFIQLSKGD